MSGLISCLVPEKSSKVGSIHQPCFMESSSRCETRRRRVRPTGCNYLALQNVFTVCWPRGENVAKVREMAH